MMGSEPEVQGRVMEVAWEHDRKGGEGHWFLV